MKKAVLGLTAAAMIAGVGAVTTASAKEYKYATLAPVSTPWGKSALQFGKRANELAQGDVKIVVYPGGQLGTEQETMRKVTRGRLEFAGQSNTAAALMVPEFALLQMPYLWDNYKQADCVFDNHLKEIYADLFRAKGLEPISWVEVGYMAMLTKEAAPMPADMKGMKIRVAPMQPSPLFHTNGGANSIPLAANEIPNALQTGLIDGATTTIVYAIAIGTHKLAPHITLNDHSHQVGVVVANTKHWGKLTDRARKAVLQAADESGALRGAIRGAEKFMLGKAAKEGATLHRMTDKSRPAWMKVGKSVEEAMLDAQGGQSRAVWASIKKAKAACS